MTVRPATDGRAGPRSAPADNADASDQGREDRRDAQAGLVHRFPDPPAPGDAIEVAPGIHWLRLPLPMALDHVNVYALDDRRHGGAGWTVVDTGANWHRCREAWEAALSGVLAAAPVERVIVTHHHPDHVGLAGWFAQRGARIVTTRTAYLFARMLVLDDQNRPDPRTVDFWRGAGMPAEMLARKLDERPFNFADAVAPLPLGYERIAEGGRMTIAGRRWVVRTGGGHAPEHATLWSDDGIVLAGDQMLPGISPNIGVYATEPEADPLADWFESCARLAGHATAEQLVLPGHRLPFTGLPFRLAQLADNHHGALKRLRGVLTAPHTAVECFPVLFSRPIRDGDHMLAQAEAMAHCLHLWHRGEATRHRRGDGAWLWRMEAE